MFQQLFQEMVGVRGLHERWWWLEVKMVVLGSSGTRWEMDVDGERWWWWKVVVRGGGERFWRGEV